MSDFYPRWVTLPDGVNKRVVQNNIEHGNVLGKKFDERAEEIIRQVPPDLEMVLKAGYGQEASERIVANEKAKAEQGIKPYGDKSIEDFVVPEPPKKPGPVPPVKEPEPAVVDAPATSAAEPTPDPIPVIPATADHPAVFKGEDGKLTIGKRSNLKPPAK